MKAVFADTFYWIALTVPTEAAHGQASQFTGEIVATDEVLSEYLTFSPLMQVTYGGKPL